MRAHRETGRGALVTSLDLELFWGVRDKRSVTEYRCNLAGVRQVVPRLLALFGKYGVHATWAAVGFLLFDDRAELLANLPERKPSYVDPRLSPYGHLGEIGAGDNDPAYHFAPDLIRQIVAAPDQELGTHTFSHYYCRAPGQTPDEFRADLAAAVKIAEEKFRRPPVSLIFPRNQLDEQALEVCRELGILAYRGNERAWFYRPGEDGLIKRLFRLLDSYVPLSGSNAHLPRRDGRGLVDVPSSRFLRPCSRRLRALEPLRMRRITTALRAAARGGRVFHLWWHPHNFGADPDRNLAFLEGVLAEFDAARREHGMRSLTMAEVANEQLGRSAEGAGRGLPAAWKAKPPGGPVAPEPVRRGSRC